MANLLLKHFYTKEENHAHNQKVAVLEVLADHLEVCYEESIDQQLYPNNRQT